MTRSSGYAPSEVLRAIERDGDLDFLAEIVDCFLADSQARMEALRRAAAARDGDALAREAHTLKGSAANMGFHSIAEACHDLQRNAKAAPDADHGPTVRGLESALRDVCLELAGYRGCLVDKAPQGS